MGKRGGAKAKRARPQTSAASPTAGASAGVFKGLKCRHTPSISKLNGLFKKARPFPHLFVEGVFKDALLTQAKDELLAGEWFRKRVDLYDFLQTDHLRRQSSSASAVATIQDALYGDEFRSWLEVSFTACCTSALGLMFNAPGCRVLLLHKCERDGCFVLS